MSNRGIFISFEGGEGSGKTTLIDEVLRRIALKNGREIIKTREPGGVPTAEKIRNLILNEEIDFETENLLYAAARNEHFSKKIQPAIDDGEVIFCDRFLDSSLVYQGFARGLGFEKILAANDSFLRGFRPSLTILLDVKPEIAAERIAFRQNNRFDLENLEFHNRIREGFLNLAKENPNRIMVVDASKNIDELADEVSKILIEKFDGVFEKNLKPKEVASKKRSLYTDGSANPNPGPGGFAVIENGAPIFLGGEENSTNIRMEGLALKKALEILGEGEAEIWTDSEFWINVLTKWAPAWQKNGWKKKSGEIKNLDIVQPLFELFQNSNAEIKWLKGHAGHEFNEMADEWANRAREGERV